MSDGDLVERVATAMRVAFEAPIREADEWRPLARYALDLAERAARDGLLAGEDYGMYSIVTTPADVVRRAVEGS